MKYNLRIILMLLYADERKVKISLQNDKIKQPCILKHQLQDLFLM